MNNYNYDYEEDTYLKNKKNALKQTNHDDTAVLITSSDSSEESVYHIDTFHMHMIINAYSCHLYKTAFKLNNKLHCYVHTIHSKIKRIKLTVLSPKSELKLAVVTSFSSLSVNVVESDTFNTVGENECEFQNWHYMMIFFQFSVKGSTKSACLNTECTMFLVDRQFLCQCLSNLFIQWSVAKIIVQDIDNKTYECQKYVHLNLYLSGVLAETMSLMHIIWNIYLINNLQTNLLIEMNIIDSEQININISSQRTIIEECQDLLTIIDITSQKNDQICQVIWISAWTIISVQFIHSITIKMKKQSLSNDWDLIFNPFYLDTSSHIVDANLFFIHIQNDSSVLIILFHHIKLEIVTEYKEEDCYTDSIENLELIILLKHILTAVDMSETHLFNSIIIYENKSVKVAVLIIII